MAEPTLKVNASDNVIVALRDLAAGELIESGAITVRLVEPIPVKHKFTERGMAAGEIVRMYGVPVGKTLRSIPAGTRITVDNLTHAAATYGVAERSTEWRVPDFSRFAGRTFLGYHRPDGRVGTRNYWLVIPLVFCENRNLDAIEEALADKLGYGKTPEYVLDVDSLIKKYKSGEDAGAILGAEIVRPGGNHRQQRTFENVDGIKFLKHEGGCGGTRQDSEALCRLLAGYINHPNVAGATVLSLGCQNAQIELLDKALAQFSPGHRKPVHVLEQQRSTSERFFVADAVKHTFAGLIEANKVARAPAPLHHLCLGLECGGSDGFSGISANPSLGHTSDLLVALGGKAILAEFPELNGVEQELINRCVTKPKAEKFAALMSAYAQRAEAVGSGFYMNPSPGNIKDGLITDAMKSAGAARKGGQSPVVDVLDYTEQATEPGLHLLCTPGNDVESTTGLTGSGANLIVFTTGLGTPTGNPIAPVVKMSSNTALARRMPDIIDIDAGTVIGGQDTIVTKGQELLELLIAVASGRATRAETLGQDDFIPWKRGVSL